jgi:hypothetical protein
MQSKQHNETFILIRFSPLNFPRYHPLISKNNSITPKLTSSTPPKQASSKLSGSTIGSAVETFMAPAENFLHQGEADELFPGCASFGNQDMDVRMKADV